MDKRTFLFMFLVAFSLFAIGCSKSVPVAVNTMNQTNGTALEQHVCDHTAARGEMCIQLYKPVCGWFDSKQMQCIKYPCAQTYGNGCEACKNENVAYWTEGACPK